jgi:cytochrome subunit of sulfide dehydrogenase
MVVLSTRWRTSLTSVEMEMKPALALLAGLMLLGSQAAAADTSQGAQLTAVCASCHGPAGSDMGIPAIMGLDEQKITGAMLAYRTAERPNHIMHAIALSLSDAEIASVARYLAARKAAPQ